MFQADSKRILVDFGARDLLRLRVNRHIQIAAKNFLGVVLSKKNFLSLRWSI